MGDQPYRKTCPELPGPNDAPQAAAIQSPAGAGRGHRQSRLRLRLKRRGQRLPLPSDTTPARKTLAPAPVQEGDPVKPVGAEDRARIEPAPVPPVSPVPPASGNRKEIP